MHSLTREPTHCGRSVWPAVRCVHQFIRQTRPSLAGRPAQRRILAVAAAIRAPEEMIAILELISSVVVAIPTDYTRY